MTYTTTIEVTTSELHLLKTAVGEKYDYHHSKGHTGPASDYRELQRKLSEVNE